LGSNNTKQATTTITITITIRRTEDYDVFSLVVVSVSISLDYYLFYKNKFIKEYLFYEFSILCLILTSILFKPRFDCYLQNH